MATSSAMFTDSNSSLFSDTFEVVEVDRGSWDNVSRVSAKSEFYDYRITIDIATNVYPVKDDEKIEVLLASSLDTHSDGNETGYNPAKILDARADSYDYIMQGRVYKYFQKKSKAEVYASYGGLLMQLSGEASILSKERFAVDSKVYLFMKKA